MKLQLLSTQFTKGSKSLRDLAQGLSTKLGYKVFRVTKAGTKPRTRLKYGNSVDKLFQYNWFKENNIPALEFTSDLKVVNNWSSAGQTVFGRELLNSSCGKGIKVILPEHETIPQCPVYTLYKKKKREFRVHVFQNTVVSVTEKKRKKGYEGEQDTKIRNLANGYVFVQTVENEPAGLRELALKAAAVSQSDFRGVDIGYNEKKDELFVIEVNSAPGIMGSNIGKYVNTIVGEVA